jgi:hypothetical protein
VNYEEKYLLTTHYEFSIAAADVTIDFVSEMNAFEECVVLQTGVHFSTVV